MLYCCNFTLYSITRVHQASLARILSNINKHDANSPVMPRYIEYITRCLAWSK